MTKLKHKSKSKPRATQAQQRQRQLAWALRITMWLEADLLSALMSNSNCLQPSDTAVLNRIRGELHQHGETIRSRMHSAGAFKFTPKLKVVGHG